MIVAVRISGMVNINGDVQETLYRLRLRRKYAAVLLEDTPLNNKLLHSVRNKIAYGKIDKDTLIELIEKRGKPIKSTDKVDAEKIISHLGKKKLSDIGLKPFFRLHPPRGGIESKKHAGVGKGVLGDNKEKINALVRRML